MLGVAAAGMTNSNMANALANAVCERCRGGFAPAEKIVNNNGELYHEPSVMLADNLAVLAIIGRKPEVLANVFAKSAMSIIEEQPLIFKNDPYHPDHFNGANCGKELTAEAREPKGELYCLPCHDKMGVPICGACRRPIEGRVVNAMGKHSGMSNILFASSVRNHSWAIVTMNGRGWRVVKPIIISSLVMCVSTVTGD
ncbi:putative LIM domain-containing protein [Naja naja]|nr:putative LIM domain-containing protein [Naja naja]